MKYWDFSTPDVKARIVWNESSTFNLQIPYGREWRDVECFTIYGLKDEHEAFKAAYEWYIEQMFECTEDSVIIPLEG